MYVTPEILAAQIAVLKLLGFRFATISEALAANDAEKICCLSFDDGYSDNIATGLPLLNKLGIKATVFIITEDVGRKNHRWQEAGDNQAVDLMTWGEIKELQRAGWEIGNHSSEHVHLARRSRQEQKAILEKSQATFVKNLGAPATGIAYPYGSFNADTVAVMQECNFYYGCTTAPGFASSSPSPFELNRFSMRGYHFWHRLAPLWLR